MNNKELYNHYFMNENIDVSGQREEILGFLETLGGRK